MAKGGNASFIVTASSVKKFLRQSEKSTACERLMGKARLHIPDFDIKRVRRKEVSAWLAERQENGKA